MNKHHTASDRRGLSIASGGLKHWQARLRQLEGKMLAGAAGKGKGTPAKEVYDKVKGATPKAYNADADVQMKEKKKKKKDESDDESEEEVKEKKDKKGDDADEAPKSEKKKKRKAVSGAFPFAGC
eukprot:68210-Prorocentrum_minimum.AAC.1